MKKQYDVVIVGSGIAGCFCALQFPSHYQVLLITKEKLQDCNSYLAQGGVCVLVDQEDRETFIEDTLRAGHYNNNREVVEIMVDTSREVIAQLEEYGASFTKRNYQYQYTKEGAHSKNRILFQGDTTGKMIVETLLGELQKHSNITMIENMMLMDIVCKNNKGYGVVVSKQQKLTMIKAGVIVLATGGIGGLYQHSTNYSHITGDGLALALKYNMKCQDITYVQTHPTTLYSLEEGRRFLISESVRGEGALLYNHQGKRFVDELLPRDIVAKAIYQEMEKDNKPYMWLSMKEITEVDIKERFPTIVKQCRKQGIDPCQDWIPIVPAQHYYMGGIATNSDGETSVKYIYAIGEAGCNQVHGKNRLASNSLLESLVFSKRAALAILKQKRNDDGYQMPEIKEYQELARELEYWKQQTIEKIKGGVNNAKTNG